jgi:hypothetical protein
MSNPDKAQAIPVLWHGRAERGARVCVEVIAGPGLRKGATGTRTPKINNAFGAWYPIFTRN